METKEVVDMLFEALRAMAIGIPGVFAVLAIFYITVKLFMLSTNRTEKKE